SLAGGSERDRANAPVHRISVKAPRLLKDPPRAPDSCVDPEVEHAEIDAAWQRIRAQWVPVIGAIDRMHRSCRQVADCQRPSFGSIRPASVGGQGDPHISRATWVVGVVAIT